MIVGVAIIAVIGILAVLLATYCVAHSIHAHLRDLRADYHQGELDEHAEWLGADAGGSFIHHGSVSE